MKDIEKRQDIVGKNSVIDRMCWVKEREEFSMFWGGGYTLKITK